VVIQKTVEEAGHLSNQVRDFITSKLDIRTEVPGLMLQNDGTLVSGTTENGQDTFATATLEAKKSPNVEIGPDDAPTLSFTSGSEGRPKGVSGRHYSLPKYFPWMSQQFRLTENDRFTMLSGIAHDPIQVCVPSSMAIGLSVLKLA
jgi:L-aminoadipate-semialdehyde dehydrogenase